jgi:hypothetical protein
VKPGMQTQLLILTLAVDSVVLLRGQAVHMVVALVVFLYVPTGQAVHATSLVVFLYVPVWQGTQSVSMHSMIVPFEALMMEAFVDALPQGTTSPQ